VEKIVTYVATARCAGVGGLAQGHNGRGFLHLFLDGIDMEAEVGFRVAWEDPTVRCTWSSRKEVPALLLSTEFRSLGNIFFSAASFSLPPT
jgi:hypothetical protein